VQQVGVKEDLYILEKFCERNHFVIIDDELHADVFDLGLLLVPRIVVAKSLRDCLAVGIRTQSRRNSLLNHLTVKL
jgi:bifunctional pyridoxal-dependent enzyme with beta-cystathionase and maltose regulon repressor activities